MKLNPYSLFKKFSLLCLGVVATTAVNAQYCAATYVNGCGTGISIRSVETTGGNTNFTNNNTNCANSTTSYSDYTATMKTVQDVFESVDVKITYGGSNSTSSLIKIWVDWNQNDTFDANERVLPASTNDHLLGNGAATSRTIKVTVPGDAKNGETRMRIRIGSQGSIYDPNFGPCGNSNYGEAEDYTFEVLNPCVPPAWITATDIDYKSAKISWNSKLNASFYEYVITPVDTIPHDTINGFYYTTDSVLNIDTFKCNVKYYVMVRTICDTVGKGSSRAWEKSSWYRDSFTTEPCCDDPTVSIKNVTSTTALVSWSPVATAYGYEYAVSTINKEPLTATSITGTTVLLKGLSSRTTYYVFVRSKCSPTPLSNWSMGSLKTEKSLSVSSLNGEVISMDIYPNPVSNVLNVKFSGNLNEHATLTILDITGKQVYSKDISGQKLIEIGTESIPAGMYLLRYTDDVNSQVVKFTKQ